MERMSWRVNGEARIMLNGIEICGTVADRLAAYEETCLEPEEIEKAMDIVKSAVSAFEDFGVDRLAELAQADREGRVHIYGKSHKCPICGAYRLVPRVDGQFYFCFHCKNQVTRAEAEAALRREQDGNNK